MKRFFVLFILTFGLLLLLPLGASAASRTAVFHNGSSVTGSVDLDASGALTLPEAPDMGTKKFVGWAVSINGQERLCGAGDSFSDAGGSGNLDFHAVGIELKTLTGAAVSYSSPARLRFDGAVALADYNRLVTLLGAEQVKCGMLIAPYMALDASAFDLNSNFEGLLNRVADGFFYSTEVYGVFAGKTDAIAGEALLEKFCGRAYVSVTFNGKTHTVYADYDSDRHVRNAHGVTACAFEDRSPTPIPAYGNLTADGCYSPYTEQQLSDLRARLDQVVYVSTLDGGVVLSKYSLDNINFLDFNDAHYVSPYRLSHVIADDPLHPTGYDIYVVTGKDGADFNTVTAYFIGGSYAPPNRAEEWKADGIYIKHKN